MRKICVRIGNFPSAIYHFFNNYLSKIEHRIERIVTRIRRVVDTAYIILNRRV